MTHIIHMATGTGKTNTAITLLKSILEKEKDSFPRLDFLAKSIQETVQISRNDLIKLSNFDPPPKKAKSVSVRLGQKGFRSGLLDLYGEVCAITGSCPREALDAAHIYEYKHCSSQRLDNGILLRADIHRLFDKNLIRINPESMLVEVDQRLSGSLYMRYRGASINTIGTKYPNNYFLKVRELANNVITNQASGTVALRAPAPS